MHGDSLDTHPALAQLSKAERRVVQRIASSFAIEGLPLTDANLDVSANHLRARPHDMQPEPPANTHE